MITKEHLILKDGEDITSDVVLCKYNTDTKKYDVTFRNGKTYPCSYLSIEWVRVSEKLNPELVHINHNGRELFNIQDIYILFDWKIRPCPEVGKLPSYVKRSNDINKIREQGDHT